MTLRLREDSPLLVSFLLSTPRRNEDLLLALFFSGYEILYSALDVLKCHIQMILGSARKEAGMAHGISNGPKVYRVPPKRRFTISFL